MLFRQKKIIYYEFINFCYRLFLFLFLSLTDNMFESLNLIIQIIVNKTMQTILQIYNVNLLSSQRDEHNKRKKSKKSKSAS